MVIDRDKLPCGLKESVAVKLSERVSLELSETLKVMRLSEYSPSAEVCVRVGFESVTDFDMEDSLESERDADKVIVGEMD